MMEDTLSELGFDSKSWNSNSRFIKSNPIFMNFCKKTGLIIVGKEGGGKRTLLNCFANSENYTIEKIDFGDFKNAH